MKALLPAVFLVACGSTTSGPPPLPAQNGLAEVCVLRPAKVATDTTMELRDNGRVVGATRGASYFCYLAVPGEHQLTSIDDDTGPTLLQAKSGARYWIHQEVATLGGDVHAHLDFVDETTANEMLEHIDTRVGVAVRGHESRDGAMPIAAARRRE